MPDSPPPETLDWLRQCAAAPGARWHRALLAEVEGQTPPEIEPIPAEGLAWLQQSARVHGATYSQVLLHVLERIELLDKDAIEQSQSNRFSFEAVIKRLELLEHDTLLIGGPEAAPVATDEELCRVYDDGPTSFAPALRACYDLGRQHGAAQPPAAQSAPPVAPAGGLVERVGSSLAQVEPEQNGFTSEDKAARVAIREVAAAARERIAPFDPSLKWGNVAQWLEQEADA